MVVLLHGADGGAKMGNFFGDRMLRADVCRVNGVGLASLREDPVATIKVLSVLAKESLGRCFLLGESFNVAVTKHLAQPIVIRALCAAGLYVSGHMSVSLLGWQIRL